MTEQDPVEPAHPGHEAPVEPAFTHPASPFIRTEAPTPAKFPGPPAIAPVASTWILYRAQIEFGLVVLAFLMVMVGSVTAVQANSTADWRYYVAVLPLAPAGLLAWLFVRAVGRLNDLQKWIQIQALAFAVGMTALVAFAYGFLEGVGMPYLNSVYVLPLMAMLWGLATATLALRYRYRR
jgi:hypothetical protein